MPDILASGDWGRDDGIKCLECGDKTYLVDDQGYGLKAYQCENEMCEFYDHAFQVQFDIDDDEREDDEYCYHDEDYI